MKQMSLSFEASLVSRLLLLRSCGYPRPRGLKNGQSKVVLRVNRSGLVVAKSSVVTASSQGIDACKQTVDGSLRLV